MKRIRIGKDISMRWEITTDGVAIPLDGRDLTVEIKSPNGIENNIPYRIDGNILIMTYYGYEQKMTGEYSITLWEKKGKPGQNVVDVIRAFELVRTSQKEDDFVGGDLQIESVDLGTENFDILTEGGYRAINIDTLQAEALEDSVNINGKTYSNESFTITLPKANLDRAGVMSADDKKALQDHGNSISQLESTTSGHSNAISQINAKLDEHTESINAKIATDRISDGAVTSEKIATSAFDSTLSVSGKIAPADIVGDKLNELKKKIVEDSEDSFLFADKNGNVAFSIGADGAKARNYNICDQDGNVIMTINEHFLDNIQVEDIINTQDTEDSFLFADKFGRVIAKIDKDGLHSKNYHTSADKNIANAYIHPWCYKQVWAFGDSHCNVDNCKSILGKIQEITGCKVDFVKNDNIGVTRTWDINSQIFKKFEYGIGSNEKSLYALKELVDKGEATADVILLEQTHYVFNDDISAEPFNGSQVIEYNTESTPFASEYAMKSALDGSIKTFLTGISADNRKSCSVLKCWYSAVSKTLNFSSASSSLNAGTFTLKLGEATFDVAVTEGMSVPEALTKLNLWQFGDVPECKWVNPAHHTAIMDNNLKVIYRGEDDASNHPISLIDNGTGITLSSMIDSSAIDFNYFLFMCHAPSKWLDMTKWKYYNRNKEEYGYAIVKGMIELAQRLFPSAEIVMWYPVSLNKDNTKYEDGTFDNYTFTQNNYHWKECTKGVRCWKECAELYNVRFIDVKDNCGMSAINFESWYDAGIHAIPEGYKRWGEILARMF